MPDLSDLRTAFVLWNKALIFYVLIDGWDVQGLFPHLSVALHVLSEIVEYMIEPGTKSRTITLSNGFVISVDIAEIKANPYFTLET